MEAGSTWRRAKRKERLEAFSDGVFAIAITILVLNLSVPSGSGDHLLEAVLAQWPAYLAYIVSFATIGATWLAHTVITEYVHRTDTGFARLNLLLLLTVSFLTLPTRLMGEYIRETQAERVATVVLGINLLVIGSIIAWMWRHAVRRSLIRPDVTDEEVLVLSRRLTPSLAGYVAMIVLALFAPIAAAFGYLVIGLLLIIPLVRFPRPRQL